MTITSYYDSTTNATSYLIICPYEGNHMLNYLNTLVTPLELSGMTWAWPDYFGYNAPVGAYLRYLWTGSSGDLVGYLTEGKEGSAIADCVLNDLDSIYATNTK